MTETTKIFIEQHLDIIESEDFDILYREALNGRISVQDLTNTLYSANIYPLLNMSHVPPRFLYKSEKSISEFNIPEGILSIGEEAFYGTDLLSVIVPEGCKEIRCKAFAFCKGLIFVNLPKSIEFLDSAIFSGSHALSEIRYNGTLEEFSKIDKYDTWISRSRLVAVKVICTDGEMMVT